MASSALLVPKKKNAFVFRDTWHWGSVIIKLQINLHPTVVTTEGVRLDKWEKPSFLKRGKKKADISDWEGQEYKKVK